MITAVHALIYSDDAPATRAYLRDVLRLPYVTDGDGDWLIFKAGPSEIGVHPTSSERGGQTWSTPRHHEICLMCDDLDATIAELASRGAQFVGEPQDRGFGIGVPLAVPGADDILLYQPRHATAYEL